MDGPLLVAAPTGGMLIAQALVVFAAGSETNSTVASAVIAGLFMLLNTCLMVYLQRERRRDTRRASSGDERPEGDRSPRV